MITLNSLNPHECTIRDLYACLCLSCHARMFIPARIIALLVEDGDRIWIECWQCHGGQGRIYRKLPPERRDDA